MPKKKFVTIGHITDDLEPKPHLGGSAAYIAVAAKRLGHESHIITKAPGNHSYIESLKKMGITAHLLPTKSNMLTSFKNFYTDQGKRTQIVTSKQEEITVGDIKNIPGGVLENSIIVASPVINEVSLKLLPLLSQYGFLAVTAQGYLRQTDNSGKIHFKPLESSEVFKSAKIIFFSEEDISNAGTEDVNLLESIKNSCQLTVHTEGSNGATVFKKKNPIHTDAFPLRSSETVDLTGAGDCLAAAFLSKWFVGASDIKNVTTFAHLYAANKIMSIQGIGINSIPSLEQFGSFIKDYETRVLEYLKKEGVGLTEIL